MQLLTDDQYQPWFYLGLFQRHSDLEAKTATFPYPTYLMPSLEISPFKRLDKPYIA